MRRGRALRRCQLPSCRALPGNLAALHHGARAGIQLAAATADALADIDEALRSGPGLELRFAVARPRAASALASTSAKFPLDEMSRSPPRYPAERAPSQAMGTCRDIT